MRGPCEATPKGDAEGARCNSEIDQLPEQMPAAEKALNDAMGYRVTFRAHEGVSRFFAAWTCWGGVACKPS